MKNQPEKKYVVVVQCHIVKERCSGCLCEFAFNNRTGGFTDYPKDQNLRFLTLTCGGCCGRAVHRKLSHFIKQVKAKENLKKEDVVVHLSSCISKDNYHGPPCPHINYLKTMICDKLGLDLKEGTKVSDTSEKLQKEGKYNEAENPKRN